MTSHTNMTSKEKKANWALRKKDFPIYNITKSGLPLHFHTKYSGMAGDMTWSLENGRDLIIEIKHGYPIEKFDFLKKGFGINNETLSQVTNIPLATIHRRKNAGRFTPDESEKLYRLFKLYKIALEVLETKENVQSWFNAKQAVFEGKTPLEYADTLPGSEEVERVLWRMEQGVVI
jgi:putative toxin-antitoxin system antitoxin component (TIGR02293 family)